MRLNKKSIAASTIALAIAGGAAFAYVNADVQGQSNVGLNGTTPTLALSVAAPANADPMAGDLLIPVNAKNNGSGPVNAPTTLKYTLETQAGDQTCPAGSFKSVYEPKYEGDGKTGLQVGITDPRLIGHMKVTFDQSLPEVQNGCLKAGLLFTFTGTDGDNKAVSTEYKAPETHTPAGSVGGGAVGSTVKLGR